MTNPAQNEGALHIARQRIISNKALLHNAARTGLPSFIQAKPFSLRMWQPPNFEVAPIPTGINAGRLWDTNLNTTGGGDAPPQHDAQISMGQGGSDNTLEEVSDQLTKKHKKRRDDQSTQWLGNKVPLCVNLYSDIVSSIAAFQAVADVAEAIIGAAYISGGRETALKVTKALNIPVLNIDRWTDFSRKVLAPPPDVSAKLRPGSIQAVETIIGHKFLRPHLLAQALVCSSLSTSLLRS